MSALTDEEEEMGLVVRLRKARALVDSVFVMDHGDSDTEDAVSEAVDALAAAIEAAEAADL